MVNGTPARLGAGVGVVAVGASTGTGADWALMEQPASVATAARQVTRAALARHGRELDDKARTSSRTSLDEDLAVVEGDVPLHDGQSQPHARPAARAAPGEALEDTAA